LRRSKETDTMDFSTGQTRNVLNKYSSAALMQSIVLQGLVFSIKVLQCW